MKEKLIKLFQKPYFIRHLITVTLAIAALAANVLLVICAKLEPVSAGLIAGGGYILLMVIVSIAYRLLSVKFADANDDEISPLLGGMTLDLMVHMNMPILLCDVDGKIIWHNRVFGARANSRTSLYGKNFSSICPIPLGDIMSPDAAPDGVDAAAFDRFYKITGYSITSHGKKYCVTVWNDQTELSHAYETIRNEEPVLAYIVIDNLDELLQYVQEKYREVSLEISSILNAWADSVGGVIKEYERDKFIFIFRDSDLSKFIAGRFDVIDKIHNVRVGESKLPVTISAGVARIGGSLAEKEKAAQSALDMALQRGGDQVVVKNETDLEFFGGRTKTMQKRTRVRSRVVANELIMLISNSSNVLVMGHRNADFDSFGACIGISRLADFCEVDAKIVVNVKNPNLTKCFEHLAPLENGTYNDRFVGAAEAQDMIGPDTLLVIVDVNNREQYEAPDIADNVSTVAIIDHHRKTEEFAVQPAISYIEPSASSACEIISELLELTLPEGRLVKEEADVMFAGISLDTKQFTRTAGARTFSAALYLRNEGALPGDAHKLFNTNLEDFISEAKFESNVIIYRSCMAISVNDSPTGSAYDRTAAAKAADRLLTVDGVKASFTLCEIDDVIHISARSNGSINVQLILEKLDGGGHFESAATQVRGSNLTDALTRLKTAIDEYLSEAK